MQIKPIDAPCKVFVIYARQDTTHLEDLRKHLRILENNKVLEVWSDQSIDPGQKWEKEITDNLDTSEIILILVSPDYYISEYIQKNEIVYATQKHKEGKVVAIPIFVRPCAWKDDPLISSLQGIPDGKALSTYPSNEREQIYSDEIVEGVKNAVERVKSIRKRQHDEKEIEAKRRKEKEEQEKEQETWENVSKSNTIPAYKAYLSEFRNGKHADQAREIIKKLEYDEIRKKEDQLWSEAILANTSESYQLYLDKYPSGIYSNIAVFRSGRGQIPAPFSVLPPENSSAVWRRYSYTVLIGLLGCLIGYWAGIPSNPRRPYTGLSASEEWEIVKKKRTTFDYQWFITKYPRGPQMAAARDSLVKLENLRDKELKNAIYYFRNGDRNWAQQTFLKVYAIDPLNSKVRVYLGDSLGYRLTK